MKNRVALAACLIAAGCQDQPVGNGNYGSTTPRYERPTAQNSLLGEAVVAVRIGELGPNFAACNSQGEVREAAADGPIPVLAAPYGEARQKGQLPIGSSFFICTRSHDQRWLGVVYDAQGQASRTCRVSVPAASRSDYSGPCESGWVASSQVRLVSGVREPPVQPSQNAGEPKSLQSPEN
jgi:hypothetical protein